MSSRSPSATMARAHTFAFSGIEAVPVEVQVQISSGTPALILVGLPDKAVAEAKGRTDPADDHSWSPHINLGAPVLFDCIEFNAALRQVDPFDDLAFLALECDMAGAPMVGEQIVKECAAGLPNAAPPALMHFYTAARSLLRARLAMAHLLDVQPRTPEHWPPLAQRYIQRGMRALDAMERLGALSPGAGHGRP